MSEKNTLLIIIPTVAIISILGTILIQTLPIQSYTMEEAIDEVKYELDAHPLVTQNIILQIAQSSGSIFPRDLVTSTSASNEQSQVIQRLIDKYGAFAVSVGIKQYLEELEDQA